MRSCEVVGTMKRVYSRGGFRKYKESNSWVWGEDECRNKMTREVGHSWKERL